MKDEVMGEVSGTLYDDGTVVLSVSAFGQSLDLDAGSYTEENFTFTFQFDNAGKWYQVLAMLVLSCSMLEQVKCWEPSTQNWLFPFQNKYGNSQRGFICRLERSICLVRIGLFSSASGKGGKL